ncbi:LysR family transcriptional regulator [Paraburkholderia flagellata]|uniref:LysR family transcriptional regulator n=1 Tax=Paraburkholderia flagellata TaxID=2883241 RepID=UPI001F335183|nr:LysR family transcriptional regulator [Paraburkholderia flagellata]
MHVAERLKGIDVFVCVAESGSFTAAANRLSLTVSAVSKGIARLETRLQVRLFDRSTRKLTLTDEGVAYYETCTAVLADLEGAEIALHSDLHKPRGKVHIDLPATYGRMHALPVILRLLDEFPLITPRITLSDRFIDPVVDGVDIFVRIGGSDVWPDEVGHHFLGNQRLIFCASPAYLRKRGKPTNVKELEEHGAINYARSGSVLSPLHLPGRRPDLSEKRQIAGRIAIGDSEGQALAAAAGYGIAQLPTWSVQRMLKEGSLVEVLPELSTDGLPLNLAWLKAREHLPKVSALLDVLKRNLSPV